MPNQDRAEKLKLEIKALQEKKRAYTKGLSSNSPLDNSSCDAVKHQVAELSKRLKAIKKEYKKLCNNSGSITDKAAFPQRFTLTRSAIGAPSQVSISEAAQHDAQEVEHFVESHPNGTPYHLLQWKQIIENCFSHQSTYYLARDRQDEIIGLLPITWQKTRFFGTHGISLPYVNYGSALTLHPAITAQLINHAISDGAKRNLDYLEFRDTKDGYSLPSLQHKVSMLLQLPASDTELDKNLGSKVRSQIKQGTRNGFRFSLGHQELLTDFYRVYSRNMRDLGTPAYHRLFFSSICKELPDLSKVAVLYLNDRPVSGGFLISYKKMLEIPWASTIKSYNKLNANMVFYRELLSYGINSGHQWFDFGRSTRGSNTYNFKKQWGAVPVNLHWYYWLGKGEKLPNINPSNKKYAFLIAMWKKLPLLMAQHIGPTIAKDLP